MHVRIADYNEKTEVQDEDSGNLKKESVGVSTRSGNVRPHSRTNCSSGQYTTSISTENVKHRVKLKMFVTESTWTERLRFYFNKNQKTSLRIRLFNFILKLFSVVLYVVNASLDHPKFTTCCGFCLTNSTQVKLWTNQYDFSWIPIVFVDRPFAIWVMQVVIAVLCFIQWIVTILVNYKGNFSQNIFTVNNLLEFLCTVPFIATIFWPRVRCLFVPVYLNIWLAKSGLNKMINDLQRATQKQKSAMFNQMCLLIATIVSLLLTCICSVQQLERSGKLQMDMFDATWFVTVTFSTVGYGDITPSIWPARLVVIITIFVALSVLPTQIEDLAFLWSQRQKQGGEYSRQRANAEKHVIMCATELRLDVIMEFLNELYAHPFFQNYYVVLLSPNELEGPLQTFLQIPIWAERVIYLQGSALRDHDLTRAKLDAADACFLLTSRQESNRDAADEKTILRAMACKDFAPQCPLYVQILKPESKFHVQFADQVICDEEYKYALLGMNCYIPGLSTIVTLLAHTSKGEEGESLKTTWKQEFGRSAGNEIYHVTAQESKFFGEFVGYRFAHASQLAHAKCGATLIGLKRNGNIRLNPGNCAIESDDILFYVCLTQEEDAVIVNKRNGKTKSHNLTNGMKMENGIHKEKISKQSYVKDAYDLFEPHTSKYPSEAPRYSFDSKGSSSSSSSPENCDKIVIGFPPIFPYIGHVTPTLCHILSERKWNCCLRHDKICEHDQLIDKTDNKPILVCAEYASQSLVNVVIPLRAHYRSLDTLHPVILVLEHHPEDKFLEAISCFPMVYYMLGTMDSLDSLLIAGITRAHTVIIIDRKSSMYAEEEYMADSRQIVAAQTIFRLFPNVSTCLELTHTSNMRFNHFAASAYRDKSEEYRKERQIEKLCSLPYMFRESFASGQVFSSSMLDTLLYQSMVKSYLTTLLRLLLGLQYSPGSGYLTTHTVMTLEDRRSYSSLFREISFRTGGILLGIYRKHNETADWTDKNEFGFDSQTDSTTPRNSSGRQRKFSIMPNSINISSVKKSVKSKLHIRSRKNNAHRLQLLKHSMTERENLDSMIQARVACLGLSPERGALHNSVRPKHNFGYILLNPPPDTLLCKGDSLYVILPESQTESAEDLGLQMGSSVTQIHTIDENRANSSTNDTFVRIMGEVKEETNLPEYDETQFEDVFLDRQSDNT